MTAVAGRMLGSRRDTAHLQVERDKGSIGDILQDGKQLLAEVRLVNIHRGDVMGLRMVGCLWMSKEGSKLETKKEMEVFNDRQMDLCSRFAFPDKKFKSILHVRQYKIRFKGVRRDEVRTSPKAEQ